MSRFIKLTNKIINIAHIEKIIFSSNPDKQYYIQFAHSNTSYFGFILAGTGWITGNSPDNNIIIYEEKNPEDYKKIEEWINNLD